MFGEEVVDPDAKADVRVVFALEKPGNLHHLLLYKGREVKEGKAERSRGVGGGALVKRGAKLPWQISAMLRATE